MSTDRLNITLPSDISTKLKRIVKPRRRSAFIAQAIEHSLIEMEKAKLKESLIEGYKARYSEDLELNTEFENTIADGLDD